MLKGKKALESYKVGWNQNVPWLLPMMRTNKSTASRWMENQSDQKRSQLPGSPNEANYQKYLDLEASKKFGMTRDNQKDFARQVEFQQDSRSSRKTSHSFSATDWKLTSDLPDKNIWQLRLNACTVEVKVPTHYTVIRRSQLTDGRKPPSPTSTPETTTVTVKEKVWDDA